MYLKSLVLKGFKSFADRSVLSMEPGITAIVGPNGSGKSNISDAVLWVLGERNAKNLRGQVMEDVIFAGSSGRKSVGVAEVTLVLDNSDGSLPVDFQEVSITRRMYRNGESDYLINNTLARRLDVLDILHDSGLGTGTHSIISQGHLDSILASRPEDRRALIEEAAGVLKHKQRKAKSQRKLEQMDQHLMRVNDVVREVERQLGPLQRKARRAMQFEEVSARLSEVQVALAVDDLRTLQVEWDKAVALEGETAHACDSLRENVKQAEAEFDRLQNVIRQESSDVAALASSQTQVSSLVERLESASRLASERRRAAEMRSLELNASLESSSSKRALAQSQRDVAQQRVDDLRGKSLSASQTQQDAQIAFDESRKARMAAEDDLQRASRKRNETQRAIDATRHDLAQAQEKLAGALGRLQAAEGLARDFAKRVEEAERSLAEARSTQQDAERNLNAVSSEDATMREQMQRALDLRDKARRSLEDAQEQLRSLNAQVRGLEEVERAATTAASPSRAWLLAHPDDQTGVFTQLSHILRIEPGYEPLVEAVLGQDALALLAKDDSKVSAVARQLMNAKAAGTVSLLLDALSDTESLPQAATFYPGKALSNRVTAAPGYEFAVKALLGDVVMCDTLDEALSLRRAGQRGLRFATREGSLVFPNGKVLIAGSKQDDGEGALERAARIDRLKNDIQTATEQVTHAEEEFSKCSEKAQQAQQASLGMSERLANAKGMVAASQREVSQATRRLDSARVEQEASNRSQNESRDVVETTRPVVESLTLSLQQLESELAERRDEVRSVQQRLEPARRRESDCAQKLSEAKLSAATLSQQVAYETHIVEERTRELVDLGRQDEHALRVLSSQQVVRKRIEPLLAVISSLTESARARMRDLNEHVEAAQAASTGAHSEASAARDRLRTAQTALTLKANELSAVREDKVRLEMRVQAAVDGIVRDQGVPLERALQMPPLDNRANAEDEAARLTRRIANLGVINPDAAREYEEMKERYDYLKAQLADLAEARRTLLKINAIIDKRMKDDFAKTFEVVNGHFQEIFAELFPGGTATLSLCNPDDLEATGVEVTAQPRGKRITKMSLMSGGEKSLVALALLFAVYRTRTTPFYILDEVEAALDDSNLGRLVGYLQKLRTQTQLIMITHQRRTMEMADVLFGVSMQADGVTQVLSQRLEKALQYAE